MVKKEFGNDKNNISRIGFLVKTMKQFKGQKYYYFYMVAFFLVQIIDL